MRSRTMNMSQGKPLKLLTLFAVPLLIGNLFQQAYNLADSIIVGQFVGAGALAAVGATGSISFLFFSVCNGISSGGGIVTAQYFGANDDDRVRRAIVNSAYIMFSMSLAMGGIAFVLTVLWAWPCPPMRDKTTAHAVWIGCGRASRPPCMCSQVSSWNRLWQ